MMTKATQDRRQRVGCVTRHDRAVELEVAAPGPQFPVKQSTRQLVEEPVGSDDRIAVARPQSCADRLDLVLLGALLRMDY